MKHLKVDAKTRVLIEKAVAMHSDGHDIEITQLSAEIDEDGVEGLNLRLRYALSQRPVDARKSIGMISAIHDALASNGDDRFVFVEHFFDDQQPIGASTHAP